MFRNNFYPRTLQESATGENRYNVAKMIFQSTHPTRECDWVTVSLFTPSNYFNPRTLQESATAASSSAVSANNDFNPRTLQESATDLFKKNSFE